MARLNIRIPMVLSALTVGQAWSQVPPGFLEHPVAVAGRGASHEISVTGPDSNVWVRKWNGSGTATGWGSWSNWTQLNDFVLGSGRIVSAPYLQAPNHANVVNLFALGRQKLDSLPAESTTWTRRICQWTRYTADYTGSLGISGTDSVVSSLAAAQTGSGFQALYAMFQDGSLRARQWDSVNWTWSGWSVLGTGFAPLAPFANQVAATQVNVFATRLDGTVMQDWWNGTRWSGWLEIPWKKVASSPSSVNFDSTWHLLFAKDSMGYAAGAIWNGQTWTDLGPSGIPVLSGVTPVVADTDSVLVYARAPDSSLIRFSWSRKSSWGAVEKIDPPRLQPSGYPLKKQGFWDRPVGVAGRGAVHEIGVTKGDSSLWTRKWSGGSPVAGSGTWSDWTKAGWGNADVKTFSAPFLQFPNHANVVNLFVHGLEGSLAANPAAIPTYVHQYTRYQTIYEGPYVVDGADSMVSSFAAAQRGPGSQLLFTTFQDGSLRYDVWDSLQSRWSGWSNFGTGFAPLPPYAEQVSDTQVNVFATRLDGTVMERSFDGSRWSSWLTIPWKNVSSSPSSVSLDPTWRLLFAKDSTGYVAGAIWNGQNWSDLGSSGIAVLSGVTPVVIDADSVLIYALAPDGSLIRFPWSREHSWGVAKKFGWPGQTEPQPTDTSRLQVGPSSFWDRPVAVAGRGATHEISVTGPDSNAWVRQWTGNEITINSGRWSSWTPLSDYVLGSGKIVSAPYMQAPNHANVVNLFALGRQDPTLRICQWTRYTTNYTGSNGIPGTDSVVSSLAAAQTGSGYQALYAVFKDGSLRARQWDSIQMTWSGWSVLGTGFAPLPPYANQVAGTQVNLFATRLDGTVMQDSWNGTRWSGWLTIPWKKVASSPASVNFDSTWHLLFAKDSTGKAAGAIWNGETWTTLPPSGIPVLSGLAPVVADTDSVLVYALAPDSSLIRFPWSRKHSWGEVQYVLAPRPTAAVLRSVVAASGSERVRWAAGRIHVPADWSASAGSLEIRDLRGARVASVDLRAGQKEYSLPLRSGLYSLRSGARSAVLIVP
jgi:hypothetical protein